MTVRQRAKRRSVRVFSQFKCAVCDQPDRFNMIRFNPMRRCEALQAVQDKMRDPERKAVCDILANGSTEAMNGANDPS